MGRAAKYSDIKMKINFHWQKIVRYLKCAIFVASHVSCFDSCEMKYMFHGIFLVGKVNSTRCIFTARVRSTTGGYVFTGVCLLTPGGIPHLHNTSTGSMSFLSGVPQWLVTGQDGRGYPSDWSQVRMGGYLPWQGVLQSGYPLTKVGTPSQGRYSPSQCRYPIQPR